MAPNCEAAQAICITLQVLKPMQEIKTTCHPIEHIGGAKAGY